MKKLFAAVLMSAALSRAEWIYRQQNDQKLVTFTHLPVANAVQLQRAKHALEEVYGVEEVYIKDHSLVVTKEPKCSWTDIWPGIANAISAVDASVPRSEYLAGGR